MDALVMCGGRGTRLDAGVEKPLFEVAGRPMVDRVVAALVGSGVDAVRAVTSPQAPATGEHLRSVEGVDEVLPAPGEGYVADLEWALESVDLPVLTVAADLPLLSPGVVDHVLALHDGGSVTVVVPAALKRRLGVSVDRTWGEDPVVAPTGVNVVDGAETDHCSRDPRLAVNVNRRRDAVVAEALLEAGVYGEDGPDRDGGTTDGS